MDNTANDAYKGLPTRIYLIETDGTLGVAGGRGPFGLVPASDEVKGWLKKYRESL